MPKNIALLTMSMDIGGAETHIYELACALSQCGHNVTVFSSGGAYVELLKEHGINHITAPLNNKKPKNLYTSYKLICDYIKNNPDCILHSHTRISNFASNYAAKKYGVPFVSTVHGKFTTGLFQYLFTRWGIRALCVSDDLKTHTIENYGFDSEKLRVTVNGINLNTFCKKQDTEFKKQLGYNDTDKIVLCVSRLNDTAANHVEKVLSFSEVLYANDKNVRIVIVGDGDRFSDLQNQANVINSRTRDNFINLVGSKTDVHKFCNIADLFIGISRSALEAIACQVPTILLGNHGYVGLLNSETEDACIETNFTCRGYEFPANAEIAYLASDILANPENYKDSVDFGLELVKKRYSVIKMAEDALKTYEEAEKDIRDYDTMLCGYYGRQNLGDDILLKVITDNLRKECKIQKCSLLTTDTKINPYKIDKCIHRFNLLKIRKYMKRTRMFILGGGSILQDATSSRSLYYYIYITKLAKKLGCKVILYSNGIGPINKLYHRKKVAKLLEEVNYITVRDNKSYEYIRKLGVKNQNIQITADEVFTIDTNWVDKPQLEVGKNYICVNLRTSSISDKFIENMSGALNRIYKETGLTPVLLPMHYNQDIGALKKLSKHLECSHKVINRNISHSSTLSILNQCDAVIAERLHAIIFGCIFTKPFIAINYDPKVFSLCAELDMSDFVLSSANNSTDDIYNLIKSILTNKQDIKNKLSEKYQEKKDLAIRNSQIANNILN